MLDINLYLLLATLAVFLTLIAILNSCLYNPLFNYMNKRDDTIKNDMQKAGSNDNEINDLKTKADKIVMDAKLNAATLREKVIVDAKELVESKLEARRAELAVEYTEFEKSLNESKEALENDLKSQVPLFKDALNAKFSQI